MRMTNFCNLLFAVLLFLFVTFKLFFQTLFFLCLRARSKTVLHMLFVWLENWNESLISVIRNWLFFWSVNSARGPPPPDSPPGRPSSFQTSPAVWILRPCPQQFGYFWNPIFFTHKKSTKGSSFATQNLKTFDFIFIIYKIHSFFIFISKRNYDARRATDLFRNYGLLTYSLKCMIISLSGLVSMCKGQKNSYFHTRSERLIIIRIKEYIKRPPYIKRPYIRVRNQNKKDINTTSTETRSVRVP